MKGVCAACLNLTELQCHHLYPLEHFRKQKKAPKVMLCKDCHRKLHQLLYNRKLSKKHYLDFTRDFIIDGQRNLWKRR